GILPVLAAEGAHPLVAGGDRPVGLGLVPLAPVGRLLDLAAEAVAGLLLGGGEPKVGVREGRIVMSHDRGDYRRTERPVRETNTTKYYETCPCSTWSTVSSRHA